MSTRKGKKPKGGEPLFYEEKKTQVSMQLTPTAIANLNSFATQLNISRSEFVERIARGDEEAIALLKEEKQGRQKSGDSREDQPKTKKRGRSLQELRKILGTDNPT